MTKLAQLRGTTGLADLLFAVGPPSVPLVEVDRAPVAVQHPQVGILKARLSQLEVDTLDEDVTDASRPELRMDVEAGELAGPAYVVVARPAPKLAQPTISPSHSARRRRCDVPPGSPACGSMRADEIQRAQPSARLSTLRPSRTFWSISPA